MKNPKLSVCLLAIGASLALSAGICRADGATPPAAGGHDHSSTVKVESTAIAAGSVAPAFTLKDTAGKARSLADYRGRPVILYSFCGCEWCQQVALTWGGIQRDGTLAKASPPADAKQLANKVTPTLVLLHGDAEFAQAFAAENRLELAHTVMLPDEDEKVSETYQAVRCPRVFVIDAAGIVRYTNNEKGEQSFKIPAHMIVARAVEALRQLSQPPAKDEKPAAPKTDKQSPAN